MNSYRVAIVGCRTRGSTIAQAYHHHPRTEVVAVCDLDAEAREALGERLSIMQRFADFDQMIEAARPDIVVLATGTESHHELALRVLSHGIHLDIEKPMCLTLAEADELTALAGRQNVRIAVHHQSRTGPSMQALARAVHAGRIGPLRHIIASDKGYYGGLGLMNIGVHLINNLLELAGPCRRVTALALTADRHCTPEDVIHAPLGMGAIVGEHITATLEFDRSVCATLMLHRLWPLTTRAHYVEVFGHRGRAFWGGPTTSDGRHDRGAWITDEPYPDTQATPWEPLSAEPSTGFDAAHCESTDEYAFVEDYVHALDTNTNPTCSGEQAMHTMEIVMAIFESAAYGRAITLPQARRDHPLLRWRTEAGFGSPPPVPYDRDQWLIVEDQRLGRSAG